MRKNKFRLFFQGPDQWTSDPEKAFNFKTIDRALSFIRKWKLSDVEVAFAFQGDKSVTRVPLDRVFLDFADK